MELKVLGIRSKGLGGDLCGTSDALTGEPASQQGEIAPIGLDGQWPAALVAKLGRFHCLDLLGAARGDMLPEAGLGNGENRIQVHGTRLGEVILRASGTSAGICRIRVVTEATVMALDYHIECASPQLCKRSPGIRGKSL